MDSDDAFREPGIPQVDLAAGLIATAVKVAGTTQAPLRVKPPMIATAPLEVGSPPNRSASLPAAGTTGAEIGAVSLCGRSRMTGSRSA